MNFQPSIFMLPHRFIPQPASWGMNLCGKFWCNKISAWVQLLHPNTSWKQQSVQQPHFKDSTICLRGQLRFLRIRMGMLNLKASGGELTLTKATRTITLVMKALIRKRSLVVPYVTSFLKFSVNITCHVSNTQLFG